MSVTIEVWDSYGRSISAVVDPVTNYISVTMPNSEPFLVDPEDSEGMAWLKRVFGDQLNFLIERG